jgi:hypothetical protein
MVESREAIPIITGSGAFSVSLIFLALILTSEKSRNLAFNWEFAVALVAISFPTSIFINQVYHALFTIFGFSRKKFGSEFEKYTKHMNILNAMVDYLAYKQKKGDKEWIIIQKRATAYSFFDMLRWITILFLLVYTITLVHNVYGQIDYWGVGLIYGITIFCTIIFWHACKNIWDEYMVLDRKIIKDIKPDLDSWIQEEEIDKD